MHQRNQQVLQNRRFQHHPGIHHPGNHQGPNKNKVDFRLDTWTDSSNK
jgi:hypothetical protein